MSMPYVIVRGRSSGAFAGDLESRTGSEVVLRQARRLWYWSGASTLSELAKLGTSKPNQCKFPAPVDRHEILDVIEIIHVTDSAKKSIKKVSPWSQH